MRVAVVLAVGVLLLAGLVGIAPSGSAGNPPIVLTVGNRDEITSRNILRLPLGPYYADESTRGVFEPVYSSLVIKDASTSTLLPYIAKGVDANGNGVFESTEYGIFEKRSGTNATDVTVYLDFNGVRWHDGVQMDGMDLMFSFRVFSLGWWPSQLRSSLFNTTVNDVNVDFTAKSWAGENSLAGNPGLRSAVRFRLQTPYPRFYEVALGQIIILPRHLWEVTGGGRHPDWGRLVYPEGDPRAGHIVPFNETAYKPFDYVAALQWEPSDSDVVGSGPFRFTRWVRGAYLQLDRYDSYFVGGEASDPAIVYDARVTSILHLPFVETIVFKVYRTEQLGVLALANGEIQYLHAAIAAEYFPDLLSYPEVRLWPSPDLGFSYIGYNMRRVPFGYSTFPPRDSTADDVGLPFRLAFGHLVDKQTIVRVWYGNFGVPADGPVYPGNLLWYNESLPRLSYDPVEAERILDGAGWADPPGPCSANGTGCRSLPGIGTRPIEFLVPPRQYDPDVASIVSLVIPEARSIGLNVVPRTMTAIWPNPIYEGTFDMFLSTWIIRDPDPEFLYSFYDCENINGPLGGPGQNYVGYCDSEFDSTIERAGTEMNVSQRRDLMKWAQGTLMSDRPVEPLVFRTVIQGTRQDRFVNWTRVADTLWNFWSWIGVKPFTIPSPIAITLRYVTAMASEGQQQFEAVVKYLDGRALAGAVVTFRILPGDGGEFVETGARNITATTGSAGTVSVAYRAPLVLGAARDIVIEVTASHPDAMSPVQRGFVLTVFPGDARFLSFRVSLPAGDIGVPDASLPIRMEVRDNNDVPMTDAVVRATVSPANGTLDRVNGTAADMASLLFTPPSDLRATQGFRISFDARKPSYYSAFANVSVLVVYREPVTTLPPSPSVLEGDTLLVAGILAAGAVVALVVAWPVVRTLRRRRPKE